MPLDTDPTLHSSDRDTVRLVAGRYELVKRIGGGGMGQVYLATQVGVGNRLALKFLAPQLCNDEGFVKRFLQEAKVSLEVTHPGAAQLLDAGRDDDGQLYLAFEYVEGEDLRTRLDREGALPFGEAREIALKVAEVLAFAHARGIVHRDIKPENVRIRRDLAGTHVKVLDFGIARLTQTAGTRLTVDGGLTGTPRYMAPEQVNGDEDVDARADLYALGLVLFEMVTGREAFTSNAASTLLLDQLQTPMPHLREARPERDLPALDAVLQRACAKRRDQRYRDVGEFIAALAAVPDPGWASPTTAPMRRPAVPIDQRATPAPPVPAAAPPSRSPLALALVALTLLGGGAAAFYAGTQRTSTPQVDTPKPATAPPWGCVELAIYDPAIAGLDVPELEARVLKSRVAPPSTQRQQLEMLKTSATNYAPAKQGCMYRAMLVAVLVSERTVLATVPEQWGQAHEVDELKTDFLELPLKQPWSLAERRAVLDRIETTFIASLRQRDEGDTDYWRRMYYGLEVACEVTDEALANLKLSKRPASCLNLTP